jgi:acyl carrier protein
MRDRVLNSIVTAIAKQKHVEAESITEALSLDELEITSLDAITIVFDIEEEFDIEVPPESLESFNTVQDIVDCISELVNTSA